MKKLLFVTGEYPYGSSETFIENEIKYIAQSFDEVYIYAIFADETMKKRDVPANVKTIPANPDSMNRFSWLKSLLHRSVWKEIFSNCLSRKMIRKVSSCCFFEQCVNNSTVGLEKLLDKADIRPNDSVLVYSYWLKEIGMVAIYLADFIKKNGFQTKIVSRCHGFDLYKERAYLQYLPFQREMIHRIDKIFPCSEQGNLYLKQIFPEFSDKIEKSYLGVKDQVINIQQHDRKVFHIVSCSNVIPVKRVHLIAESLLQIENYRIQWTHFGDGPDLGKLKYYIENMPSNISVQLKGRVANEYIYDFYNQNDINLFINVSESEGLPVSIMEAISFGIPVLATEVGGTSEIVENGRNGFLLNKYFAPNELTKKIESMINIPETEYQKMCSESRKIYKERFVAEKNYKEFLNKIQT